MIVSKKPVVDGVEGGQSATGRMLGRLPDPSGSASSCLVHAMPPPSAPLLPTRLRRWRRVNRRSPHHGEANSLGSIFVFLMSWSRPKPKIMPEPGMGHRSRVPDEKVTAAPTVILAISPGTFGRIHRGGCARGLYRDRTARRRFAFGTRSANYARRRSTAHTGCRWSTEQRRRAARRSSVSDDLRHASGATTPHDGELIGVCRVR